MVRNIAKAKIPVVCYARNPLKAADILSLGIPVYGDILELASLPIIVSIVTDDKALVPVSIPTSCNSSVGGSDIHFRASQGTGPRQRRRSYELQLPWLY